MSKQPTYTDKTATGGDTNTRGLEYQKAYMLANLPHWLAHSAFSAATHELVGDIEVKYFDSAVGELIDFYQVKNYTLTPTQLRTIAEDFQSKVDEGPFRHFYIVCNGLSAEASPIGSALDRIRRQAPADAAAFYPTDTPLDVNTTTDFISQVVKTGGTEDLGRFLLTKVSIEFRHSLNEINAEAMFKHMMQKYYPEVEDLPSSALTSLYQRVRALVEDRRGQPITRSQLIHVITGAVALPLPSFDKLGIHTLHDVTPYRGNAISLPWAAFFGGRERSYPDSEQWNDLLLAQLARVQAWLQASDTTKTLLLTGQRRLSANIALGWAFPAVGEFTLVHEHRGSQWRTDQYQTDATPKYDFAPTFQLGENETIIVSIGIGHDIAAEVRQAAETLGLSRAAHLDLHTPLALTCADQVNLAVQNVKVHLKRALHESNAQTIHLFLATPATFALFLGHRLNGVTSVQCYERRAPTEYVPTCRLKAQ